jgi:carboxylesterase type B
VHCRQLHIVAELKLAAYVENASPPVPDSEVSEDCLFLDVFVPKKVHDNRNEKGKKAPVLLW